MAAFNIKYAPKVGDIVTVELPKTCGIFRNYCICIINGVKKDNATFDATLYRGRLQFYGKPYPEVDIKAVRPATEDEKRSLKEEMEYEDITFEDINELY